MVDFNLPPAAYDTLAEALTQYTFGISKLTDALTESAVGISKNVPMIGNAAICADSIYTAGRAGINFYCSPSPVAKVFFGASCVCGTLDGVSSGVALATSFARIPLAG